MRSYLRFFRAMLGLLMVSGLAVEVARAQAVRVTVQQTFQFGTFVDATSMNEFQTALRNILAPYAKVTVNEDEHTIVVDTTAEQMLLAQKIVSDLNAAPADAKSFTTSEMFLTKAMETPRFLSLIQRTFYLPGLSSDKASDVITKLHKTAETQNARTFFVASQSAILVRGTTEEVLQVQRVIADSSPAWVADAPGAASAAYRDEDNGGGAADAHPLLEQTIYLANGKAQNYSAEVLVAMRNMVAPGTKIFLVYNRNAILLLAPEAELKLAQKIASDLDVNRAGS